MPVEIATITNLKEDNYDGNSLTFRGVGRGSRSAGRNPGRDGQDFRQIS